MQLAAEAVEDAELGGVDGADGEAELGGDVGGGAAGDHRLPAGLPGTGLELAPHQLRGPGHQIALILLLADSFGRGGSVDRVEDIGPAVERALASGKPAVIHVEVDQAANSTFNGIPGFLEFRNWFGEEGDFLGVPGAAPAPAAGSGGGSTENSSGY